MATTYRMGDVERILRARLPAFGAYLDEQGSPRDADDDEYVAYTMSTTCASGY